MILGLSLGMMATYPKIATYVEKNQEGYYDQYDIYSQITIKNYLTYIEVLEERHDDFIGLAKDLYDDKGNSRNLGSWCETLLGYYIETNDFEWEYFDETYLEGGNEYSNPTVSVDYRRILKTINPQLARELADVSFEQLTEEQLVQVIECLLPEMISEEIQSLREEYHLSELDSIVRETRSESEANEDTENPSFSTEELEKDKSLAVLFNELTEKELKELQKEYQYFIRLDYDAAGRLSIPYFYGESGKSSKQFAYESLKETSNPYFMSSKLAPIKNMTFIYGIPKGSTAGFDYGSGYYATSTISIFYESIVVLLLTGFTLLIPLAGLSQFKLIKGWFKWPLEMVIIIGICLIAFYWELMIDLIYPTISNPPLLLELSDKFTVNLTFIQNLSSWFVLLLVTFMTLLYFKQLIVQGGKRTMRQNCWCYRLGRFVYRQGKQLTEVDLKEENMKKLALFILAQMILVSLCCLGWFFGIIGVIIYSVGLYLFLRKYLLKIQQNYATLFKVTEALAEGDLDVEMNQDLGIFNAFKQEIVAIQGGFKKAVDAEVRSQKMRTDLIANVSHDLKTPLTSIITYTDLLKDETLDPQKRIQYLQTLDQKAQRLKILIEDLFEMSKASSGNITMNLQKVEVTSLMKQTLLELEDKIQEANLMVRRQFPEHKVFLMLDSERTFRIFDNLILNMTKYAMPGTRAYIEILDQQEVVQIVFKNMSADELCVSAQELTERFVRGDQSRHTEGSGLGLAISKSFVELQGGSLDIQIDGDLFKVVLTFNK